MNSLWLNFAGKTVKVEVLEQFQQDVHLEGLKLDYSATPTAQLDTQELDSIAIKIA